MRRGIGAWLFLAIGVSTVFPLATRAATEGTPGKPAELNQPAPRPLKALAMHPMWLIIKEDTVCTERTPPWGAPSIEEYSKRLSRNLQRFESAPETRVNYDFSAGELEDVKAMYPDLARRMGAAIRRGQLGIINGTYSQAHLHTLSLEGSVRQFAVGTSSIRDNFGCQVRTYAMQEPGYTDQTPQILKAFGYRYAHRGLHRFPTNQKAFPGETLTGKEAFCFWRGLDGTEIPTWQPGAGLQTSCPDMRELRLDAGSDYVVLDQFLDRKFAEDHAPKPKLRMYVPWSYIEGNNADELCRLNASAETALVQMETMVALAKPFEGWPVALPDPVPMWKTWLLAQHHDAAWVGAPELRAKCCGWLREVIRQSSGACSEMLKSAAPDSPGGRQSLLLFAVYPKRHRGVARVTWTGSAPEFFLAAEGRKTATQVMPTGPDQGKLLVPYACAGAGREELVARGTRPRAVAPKPVASDWKFANDYFSATFQRDGSIKTIRTRQGAMVLDGQSPAAALSATVGETAAGFESTVNLARRWKGPVADVLESSGSIGTIPVTRRLILYHDLPWFEMEVQCGFKNDSLGGFYDDGTKLALQWPVAEGTSIVHGIGGGSIVPDEPARAFYPVNWLDLADDAGGLAMINFGTLKHYQTNGQLRVILAWGGDTAHMGNRVSNNNGDLKKQLDLRLNGRQVFRFVFYPHNGDWRSAGVPDLAMSLLRPPVAGTRLGPRDGKPAAKCVLALAGNLIPTSVAADGNRVVCRVYEPYGQQPVFVLRHLGQEVAPQVRDVAGNQASAFRAWGIANLVVAPHPAGSK
jgi:hypothetical protein